MEGGNGMAKNILQLRGITKQATGKMSKMVNKRCERLCQTMSLVLVISIKIICKTTPSDLHDAAPDGIDVSDRVKREVPRPRYDASGHHQEHRSDDPPGGRLAGPRQLRGGEGRGGSVMGGVMPAERERRGQSLNLVLYGQS